jgi:acetyl esterase/lipase
MLNAIVLALSMAPASVDMNVVYDSPGGTQVHMDIYKPAHAGDRPAVVVIHGGGWMAGDRKDMATFCDKLVQRGYVVANVQYRLAPKHKWPAMLDDVQSAVRFLRRNATMYRIDPKRVASLGASAGGHLALMLGVSESKEASVHSTKVAAVVNIFGVSDFTAMLPTWSVLADTLFGVKAADIRAVMATASPLSHLDKDDAAVFTFHGTADWLVPLSQSIALDTKLKELGIAHEFIQIKDSGHEVDVKRQDVRDALEAMATWLDKQLKP